MHMRVYTSLLTDTGHCTRFATKNKNRGKGTPNVPTQCPYTWVCPSLVGKCFSVIYVIFFASFAVKKRTNRKVRKGLRKERKEKEKIPTKCLHTPYTFPVTDTVLQCKTVTGTILCGAVSKRLSHEILLRLFSVSIFLFAGFALGRIADRLRAGTARRDDR